MHNESFGRLIACLHRNARGYFEKELSQFGLGSGTHVFLVALFHHDGISQNELTKELNFNKANTTRAIKKLMDLGYVKRERDKHDSRAWRIFITPKAKKIAPQIISTLHSWSDILSTGFTPKEKKMAMDLLKKMAENALFYKNSKINQKVKRVSNG